MHVVLLTAVLEVFYVGSPLVSNAADAHEKGCGQFGARLASVPQITEAYNLGSEVCMWGHAIAQGSIYVDPVVAFPMQAPSSCSTGSFGVIVQRACSGSNNCNVGAACYGTRPPKGTVAVRPWNERAGVWSMRDAGEWGRLPSRGLHLGWCIFPNKVNAP